MLNLLCWGITAMLGLVVLLVVVMFGALGWVLFNFIGLVLFICAVTFCIVMLLNEVIFDSAKTEPDSPANPDHLRQRRYTQRS